MGMSYLRYFLCCYSIKWCHHDSLVPLKEICTVFVMIWKISGKINLFKNFPRIFNVFPCQQTVFLIWTWTSRFGIHQIFHEMRFLWATFCFLSDVCSMYYNHSNTRTVWIWKSNLDLEFKNEFTICTCRLRFLNPDVDGKFSIVIFIYFSEVWITG